LDEDLLLPASASETTVSNIPALNEVSLSEAPSASPSSPSPSLPVPTALSQGKEASVLLNPEDDPGDLFEPAGRPQPAVPEPSPETAAPSTALESEPAPAPERSSVVALAIAEADSVGAESLVESSNTLRPLRFPAASVPPAVPHSVSTDPLAPVRALSDEEMIALFS
jgi:hypothetical protein